MSQHPQQEHQSQKKEKDETLSKIRTEFMSFLNELGSQSHQSSFAATSFPTTHLTSAVEENVPKTSAANPASKSAANLHDDAVQLAGSKAAIHHQRRSKVIEDYCNSGDIVNSRFRVIEKFKEGGFGQIYRALDLMQNNFEVALKVERPSEGVNIEEQLLKKLRSGRHSPRLFDSGSTDKFKYVAMQLLGKNLSEIRKECTLSPQRLSLSSTCRAVRQCVEGLEDLHSIGYLHRDIKPSNFVIGFTANDVQKIYLLDFGLCRYYRDDFGKVKTPRATAGFRGTVRYASLTAHDLHELSRRDDMWSWFYTFYELMIGFLAWRKTNDKHRVAVMKRRHTPEAMCHGLPGEVKKIVTHFRSLAYEDQPNYELVSQNLAAILTNINAKDADPYDWQVDDCQQFYHWIVKLQ